MLDNISTLMSKNKIMLMATSNEKQHMVYLHPCSPSHGTTVCSKSITTVYNDNMYLLEEKRFH